MKGAASATAGQLPVADGAGETVFTSPINVCGQMYISTNTTATVVTAAADATLATNTDYAEVIAGLTGDDLTNVGFSVNKLLAQRDGTYLYHITGALSAASTSKTAIKLRLNTANIDQKTVVDTSAGVYTPISLTGIVTLVVDDELSIYLANTVGDVTIRDLTVTIVRLGVL